MNLINALTRGGLFQTPGTRVNEVLRSAAQQIPGPIDQPSFDRDHLAETLIEREDISSTGVGNGVALPHPATPGRSGWLRPQVSCHYLTQPIDFGAFDGQPVHTLFLILAHDSEQHLEIMKSLARVLRDPAFRQKLVDRVPLNAILECLGGGATEEP
ncbi:MAG: PTS sugar transporter subunit IIA [Acidobacteria bacterium]|nr:PTS sugar transporter subunit IIA [Acidobacteriota bacterium]MCB9396765.1 PTS sugar transporter subunit IIA [Acidobacteriota bacterium]